VEEVLLLVYKTYGLVGLIIFAPFIACIYLWRENKAIHKETSKQVQVANDRVSAALQQRVVDAQAITNKLVEIVSEQASVNKETNLALERLETKLAFLKVRT
jgi:NACalpha-BTF3-like transcription factor